MSPITAAEEKPAKIKEPEKPKLKEPKFKAVQFKSQFPNTRYVVIPKYTSRERNPVTMHREKTVTAGKYLFTDPMGLTSSIDDVDILEWYLKPSNVSYRYEMVCIWPDREKVRPFGQDIGDEERKRIEDIIAWKKAGG
jgi:hypothetical protein